MMYEKRKLEDSDTKLIKFTDKDPDGNGTYDNVSYVRFKYDLSKDQIDSIKDEADTVDYSDFDTMDEWVADVVDSAMKKDCWKHDKDNDWEFWEPYPCLEVEV